MSSSDKKPNFERWGEAYLIPVDNIRFNRYTHRTGEPGERGRDFKSSIENWGVLHPIGVVPLGEGQYEVAYGDGRLAAYKDKGRDRIPARIFDADHKEQITLSLVENIHRKGVSQAEKASGAFQLAMAKGLPQDSEEVAKKFKTFHRIINNTTNGGELNRLAVEPDNITERTREQIGKLVEGRDLQVDEFIAVAEICDELSKSANTIYRWLKSISLSEEVEQKIAAAGPDEQLPQTVLSSLASIDDDDFQEEVYDKVVDQKVQKGQNAKELRKIVSGVKRIKKDSEDDEDVSETLQKVMGDSSTIEDAHTFSAITQKEPDKYKHQLYQVVSFQHLGDDEPDYVEHKQEVMEENLDSEELKINSGDEPTTQDNVKEVKVEPNEGDNKPSESVQKRGSEHELMTNWRNLSGLLKRLSGVHCPECGKPALEHLKFECHDLTVKEAQEIAHDKVQKRANELNRP